MPSGASPGAAWYWRGWQSPPPSIDLPRRGAAAVAAGGTGRGTVPAGGVAGGPLCVDVVAGRIRFLVRGGRSLVVGGVWGWSAQVLPSHAPVLRVHGGLWPGGVGWWAVVVLMVVLVVVVVGALVALAQVVGVMVLRVCS